ncbi:MAG: SDR family NAD(P)-dependent oxidoreductase, partial [Bacilli bacterium]|nr:SDR family NAD(P)-dependent oxidoreductase [Bacilli bacterium]
NNAGISIDNDISLKDSNEFKRVIDVNLLGSFLVTKYVSKHMLNEKEGNIIFVSSTNGIDTEYEYSIDYDASKAGVISLMHNFSKLLSPYIRVNTVAPGWVNTDYISNNLNDEFIQMEKDKVLLNRFANSIEIAKVIYFLSSDSASYINNTVIRVDGGLK